MARNANNEYSFEVVKAIIKIDREKLTQHEVEPEEIYKTGKPRRMSPKNCYQKAFKYVSSKSKLDGVLLVHGLYKPYAVPHHSGHAWVELPNDIVFDGVIQRFYKKQGYYEYYEIIRQVEYSCSEMYDVGFKAGGTYGPWHYYSKILQENV